MKEQLYICKYGCNGTIPGICNTTPCKHSIPHQHTGDCGSNYFCAFPGEITECRENCRKPQCQEYKEFNIPKDVFEL
jgi:hypothetical protein